ncbi:MAG: hypothetical protein ACFBSG_08630 [Leptolyngbyaceae cyanobacterium]
MKLTTILNTVLAVAAIALAASTYAAPEMESGLRGIWDQGSEAVVLEMA